MADMANAHELLISQSEAQLLAGLIGHRLECIRFDRSSASLEFDSCALLAYPEPGCGGSPMFPNKDEVMRLFVRLATPEESAHQDSSTSNQLDLRERVRNIHILHSLVLFSEPVEAGPQKLGPIQLPPGLGYDFGCISPSRVAREHFEQLVRRGCANLVDNRDSYQPSSATATKASVFFIAYPCAKRTTDNTGDPLSEHLVNVPLVMAENATASLRRRTMSLAVTHEVPRSPVRAQKALHDLATEV